ncbi:MAG: patatin-like phospholipase family protein [Gammaproteobacteria bacterium]|nr:patatin-like phospholipase family protein [Gammaproteobacteria bacterium]MDP2141691.1 patatin-like phospholipase family protein [Gammaproteobacteria bacterium]MDP2347926.1 patatin-like phospholipase family protein [Gammaproteobacteria bacterium]
MQALQLYAGPTALQKIQRDGLRAEDFRMIVGASGGPKWFVLYGLDRYLFGDFFAGRQQPLMTLGSSAGAWRLACLGLADPVAAMDRLAFHYSRQRYSDKPLMQEISHEARKLVDIVLGANGPAEIVGNRLVSVHIVADRARGLLKSDKKVLLMGGLGLCAAANVISRRTLRMSFERVIFHSGRLAPGFDRLADMPTRCVPLREDNVREALLASGSIPMIMEGVRNVPGAPAGVYRDGGITDYHFDMPFLSAGSDGGHLVLYPHFYSRLTPGWFDKALRWRRVNPAHYHNVLLLAPSPEFVRALPYGKIPDRKDFEIMDYDTRFTYWQRVLAESERLAEEFAALVESERGVERIRPFAEMRHH